MEGNIVLASGNRQLLNSLSGSQLGYAFYGVQDVPTCLGVLMHIGGDVLLLDHDPAVLGGIDSISFFDELKKMRFVLPPAIMLAPENSLSAVQPFLDLGGTDFIQKPVSEELLKIRLGKVLGDISFRADAVKFRLLTGALEEFIYFVSVIQQQLLKQVIQVNVQCTDFLGRCKNLTKIQPEEEPVPEKDKSESRQDLKAQEYLSLLAELQAANAAAVNWLDIMNKLNGSFSRGKGYFYLVMDELKDRFKSAPKK